MNPEQHLPDVEESLALSAPTLPPGLKARTLARCADRSVGRNRNRQGRLMWAAVGVCAAQWLIVLLLDAQSAHLMTAKAPNQSANAMVALERTPDVWMAMRERSEMLTTLMANRNDTLLATESG